MSDSRQTPTSDIERYQVLARKYRPETFADLVGQEAMVRTLRNAFEANRIAQSFILTGIRGTGKTTTARIIAKGMNCVGPDGSGEATTDPCGKCENCQAISEGRHVDVMEMDAASRTGVNDIREIIDSVHYRAASARYKIYIVDEVHMLSTNAFNALLKTLEEPPEHVKFIFATTEIRKVPVTVLSRCQRFDLRRIQPDVQMRLLRKIADAENGLIDDGALALIVRASEGSARDATSLLDQALSQGTDQTTTEQVRGMLGLADRGRVLDLFDLIMKGDTAGALKELQGQFTCGADPLAVLRDLAAVTHWISVIKITPTAVDDPTVGPDERRRGSDMAKRLHMRPLTRMWQMLLKALNEVAGAPDVMMAAEMAIIRITHVADLPSPEDLIAKLKSAPMPAEPAAGGVPSYGNSAAGSPPSATPIIDRVSGAAAAIAVDAETSAIRDPAQALSRYPQFDDVVDLIRANHDIQLLVDVESCVRLVRYQPGRVEFQPTDSAPVDLASRLGERLKNWTGVRWVISLVNEGGGRTIGETRDAGKRAMMDEVRRHPLVKAVFDTFPNAKITDFQSHEEIAAKVKAEALPDTEDSWDPFEGD
ncbi:MAG: DNA polymerase III subunit gamma/tau [Rhodobacter sp.]|nr:DNA polymerase III subunit gamma/tau [Rhodobacter sp.]